jgi:tetratricopeptide (TPR) repeat protein
MMHLLVLAVVVAASVGAPASERAERARRWMEDVIRHQPGTMDAAAVEVASWSNADLQTLWVDLTTIGELLYRPKLPYFAIVDRRLSRKPVNYTPAEVEQLKGIATRGREIFGPDGTLRRGALLHADIGMNVRLATEEIRPQKTIAPERVTVHIGDGQALDVGSTAIHWETARTLVDRAPHDTFARDWYRATSAWMELHGDHDVDHIDHAVQLFPDDPDLLFLDGCMHEGLASPQIQTSIQSMKLPAGFSMNVGSARSELKLAENALRRAVNFRLSVPDWHLHYGRVLDLLGEHDAAIRELSEASGALDDDDLEYVGVLFVGAAQEAAGHLDAARAAYESAAGQAPAAQSPVLALMELARRRGDRGAALQELRRLSAMADSDDRDDPWWNYWVSHVRNAGDLLKALWQPFRAEAPL